jgi:hypothetical protein
MNWLTTNPGPRSSIALSTSFIVHILHQDFLPRHALYDESKEKSPQLPDEITASIMVNRTDRAWIDIMG